MDQAREQERGLRCPVSRCDLVLGPAEGGVRDGCAAERLEAFDLLINK